MARRLKPTDAGYVALLLGCDPAVAALQFFDPAELYCELDTWGEGAEVVYIDSTLGLVDPGGLGFVQGWSQKKGH